MRRDGRSRRGRAACGSVPPGVGRVLAQGPQEQRRHPGQHLAKGSDGPGRGSRRWRRRTPTVVLTRGHTPTLVLVHQLQLGCGHNDSCATAHREFRALPSARSEQVRVRYTRAGASSGSSTTSTPPARSSSAPRPSTNRPGSRHANTTRSTPAARISSVQVSGREARSAARFERAVDRGAGGGPPAGAEVGERGLLRVVVRIAAARPALREHGRRRRRPRARPPRTPSPTAGTAARAPPPGRAARGRQNVFEKRARGPQLPVIQQVLAALGGPLRASQTHSHAPAPSRR